MNSKDLKGNRFTKWLQAEKERRELQVVDMAKLCRLSPTMMGFLLSGEREPSFNSLIKISEGLNVPFKELAFLYVFKNSSFSDNNRLTLIKLYGASSKVAGSLSTIYLSEILEYYNAPNDKDWEEYVKQYLVDVIYKTDIEKYEKEKLLKKLNIQKSNNVELDNKTLKLKDIVLELYDLDENELLYINELVALYKKHHK